MAARTPPPLGATRAPTLRSPAAQRAGVAGSLAFAAGVCWLAPGMAMTPFVAAGLAASLLSQTVGALALTARFERAQGAPMSALAFSRLARRYARQIALASGLVGCAVAQAALWPLARWVPRARAASERLSDLGDTAHARIIESTRERDLSLSAGWQAARAFELLRSMEARPNDLLNARLNDFERLHELWLKSGFSAHVFDPRASERSESFGVRARRQIALRSENVVGFSSRPAKATEALQSLDAALAASLEASAIDRALAAPVRSTQPSSSGRSRL